MSDKVKTYSKPDWMTKQDWSVMIENFHKGIICVCEKCYKVDIDPYEHFKACKPTVYYRDGE